MAARPSTARSEISSAISEDGYNSRPPSAIRSDQPSLPNPSVSQHGFAHLRGVPQSTNRALRNPPAAPSSTGGSSRPQSPVSTTSRTHVPSLTAQGFLRPMSSQRLQAQRFRRPAGGQQVNRPEPIPDGDHDDETESVDSEPPPQGHRPVHSVTTDYTHSEHQGTYDGTSHDYASQQEGETGLVNGARKAINRPKHLNIGAAQNASDAPQKSPLSFRSVRSGLSLASKGRLEPGHQHLPSTTTSPRYPPPKTPQPAHNDGALGKNYEYFEGNTIFWWGGRFQNARDRPINIATGILIVLPAILFLAFSASFLWQNVSPAIPIIFAYLSFLCFSSFIHASLVDPGVFPRNIHPFPPGKTDPLAIGPPMNDWVMVRLATSQTAAMDVPVKYCKTCNIWRPPRCYHCRVCDNCVETLDHHCVWLNNCVGRRNYRYFFSFVSTGTLLSLLLSFASLGHIIAYSNQNSVSFGSAIGQCRVPFAMFLYGLVACPYPGALWVYHLMLMGKGETTREYLASRRFPKAERHRPFTQGSLLKNWIAVLGRSRPPTYLHFKKNFEEGDQRFGPRRGDRQGKLNPEAQSGGMEMKPVSTQRGFEGPQSRQKLEVK